MYIYMCVYIYIYIHTDLYLQESSDHLEGKNPLGSGPGIVPESSCVDWAYSGDVIGKCTACFY